MKDDIPSARRLPHGVGGGLVVAITLASLLLLATAVDAVEDATTPPEGATTVTYAPSDDVVANPQRGFYRHTETHAFDDGSGYTPLDAATLRGYRADGVTQILRVFYLEAFADTPTLDPGWLALVRADFATARDAGVSVIVRFAYGQGSWPYVPPYGDAPVDVVLAHIGQLGPVLRENADVIATVQAGFIGLWGEWYYTDHFAADPAEPGIVTDGDWENRAAVVRALLRQLPSDITVQVRTMRSKQRVLGLPTGPDGALRGPQAYDGSDVARIGHHNDCFLGSGTDFGTFQSFPIRLDEVFLARDTQFVPMGGETCAVNPPRSEWESASALMARYHFSYLNGDYHPDALASWGAEGLAETAKRLGYRFVLERSVVTNGTPADDGEPVVQVDVRNEGWAAPYNRRPARLVLSNAQGAWAVPFVDAGSSLPADARRWAAGTTTTVAARACGVPVGTYTAYLELPSPYASLHGDPDYSIATANVGTWVAESGWNDLFQIVTIEGRTSGPGECGQLAAVPVAVPVAPGPTRDSAGATGGA